jgi:hypothetical protein
MISHIPTWIILTNLRNTWHYQVLSESASRRGYLSGNWSMSHGKSNRLIDRSWILTGTSRSDTGSIKTSNSGSLK